jgi:transcriptional regulator with XRE-family HTH domain
MSWSFAARLQAVVEEKGWSQKVLAQRSGLHPVQISRLLRGERTRVEAETVRRLAKALEVSADYLLGLDDPEAELGAAVAHLVGT